MQRSDFAWTAVVALLVVGALGGTGWAQGVASSASPPLNAADTMRDALRRLQEAKKPVELVLKNGKSYRGLVGSVGDHAVVITEIQGKEFYDALVQLDEISAIEVRARGER